MAVEASCAALLGIFMISNISVINSLYSVSPVNDPDTHLKEKGTLDILPSESSTALPYTEFNSFTQCEVAP